MGGGGLTNSAITKEEKRVGYSPTKVLPFDLIEEDVRGKLRSKSPQKSPTKLEVL